MFGYFANFKRDGEPVVVIYPYWPDTLRGNDVIEIRMLRSGQLLARFTPEELEKLIPVLRTAIGDDTAEDEPKKKNPIKTESHLTEADFITKACRAKVFDNWFFSEDPKK